MSELQSQQWSSDTLGAGLKTLAFQSCKDEEAQELAELREIQDGLVPVALLTSTNIYHFGYRTRTRIGASVYTSTTTATTTTTTTI